MTRTACKVTVTNIANGYSDGWNAAMDLVAQTASEWSNENNKSRKTETDGNSSAELRGAEIEMNAFAGYVRDVLRTRCP